MKEGTPRLRAPLPPTLLNPVTCTQKVYRCHSRTFLCPYPAPSSVRAVLLDCDSLLVVWGSVRDLKPPPLMGSRGGRGLLPFDTPCPPYDRSTRTPGCRRSGSRSTEKVCRKGTSSPLPSPGTREGKGRFLRRCLSPLHLAVEGTPESGPRSIDVSLHVLDQSRLLFLWSRNVSGTEYLSTVVCKCTKSGFRGPRFPLRGLGEENVSHPHHHDVPVPTHPQWSEKDGNPIMSTVNKISENRNLNPPPPLTKLDNIQDTNYFFWINNYFLYYVYFLNRGIKKDKRNQQC